MKIIEKNDKKIAQFDCHRIAINNTAQALDIMGNATYHGANSIIIHEKNLNPAFFDLKTKLAGEILQKFSTYQVKLAIVGDFSKYKSKSLTDFIYESNKHGKIVFVGTKKEAIEKLSR